MDATTNAERVEAETQLLQSMFPEEVSYNAHNAELAYHTADATMKLRLPPEYPSSGLPYVVSARAKRPADTDLRDQVQLIISAQAVGEECLDAVMDAFLAVIADCMAAIVPSAAVKESAISATATSEGQRPRSRTVVVWLHHLLALSKRKLALAPDDVDISGVTKPGYPGVMVFSGPWTNVREHVDGLKALNWAAFQVRLDVEEEWAFAHGRGVVECETMGEVVRELEMRKGNGEGQKAVFLEAMRMR